MVVLRGCDRISILLFKVDAVEKEKVLLEKEKRWSVQFTLYCINFFIVHPASGSHASKR